MGYDYKMIHRVLGIWWISSSDLKNENNATLNVMLSHWPASVFFFYFFENKDTQRCTRYTPVTPDYIQNQIYTSETKHFIKHRFSFNFMPMDLTSNFFSLLFIELAFSWLFSQVNW